MNSLKTLAISFAMISTGAIAGYGDPTMNNTTNMDNTGANVPVNTRMDNANKPRKFDRADQVRANKADNYSVTSAERVRSVQDALKGAGYDIGVSDGVLGIRTTTALKEFQRNNNIDVTGTVNQATLDRLGLEFGAEQKNNTDTFAE